MTHPKVIMSEIPHGVGAPPKPGMDPPRKGKVKMMCIKVRMLDDTIKTFHLGHKANGQILFDEVCRHLNLLESDYFGLEFIDGYNNRCWLEKDKSILRQITSTQCDARFYFIVKFYTPNPAELEEEYTRYLFALQIRRDLAHGELICNENTGALLASFIVQSECGDFSADDYPDHTYLSATHFVPNQTAAFQTKVMENHRKLIGMSPAEADLALLETARRCDFYGIKLHVAKDIEGTDVALSVAHMGIKVFHQLNCISTFSWAKIRKLSFKRKRLMIKLHPESYQYYKEIIEFNFENRNESKNFWKKCVEHHAFFRCLEAPIFDGLDGTAGGVLRRAAQRKADTASGAASVVGGKREVGSSSSHHRFFFSHGSSFRYQGRTQKQLIDYVREHRKRREPFQRPLRAGSHASAVRQHSVDPYAPSSVIGATINAGATAPSCHRRIPLNDPMSTSTISASSHLMYGGGTRAAREGSTGSGRGGASAAEQPQLQQPCCALYVHGIHHHHHHPMGLQQLHQLNPAFHFNQPQMGSQQQQQQFPVHHHLYHQHQSAAQSYPDVYYSVGGKPSYTEYASAQLQPHQQQQRQQQNYPQQFYQHHQQQLLHEQKQRDQNNNNSNCRRRPKSVYATGSGNDAEKEGNALKAHKSYGDVGATTVIGAYGGGARKEALGVEGGVRGERESSAPITSTTVVQNRRGDVEDDDDYDYCRRGDVCPAQQQQPFRNPAEQQQVPDQMSTSLPNVLAEDIQMLCEELQYGSGLSAVAGNGTTNGARNGQHHHRQAAAMGLAGFLPPPKSMSGDNFLADASSGGIAGRQHAHRQNVVDYLYDNMSEGSYRLGKSAAADDGGADSSSQSDVASAVTDSRVYATTFTTKRVGNVIVKRVIDSNKPSASTRRPVQSARRADDEAEGDDNEEDEEEDLSSYSDLYYTGGSSVSAPVSARSAASRMRLMRANAVPIDGRVAPNFHQRPTPPRTALPAVIDEPFTTEVKGILRKARKEDTSGSPSWSTANERDHAKPNVVNKPTIIRPVLMDAFAAEDADTKSSSTRSDAPPATSMYTECRRMHYGTNTPVLSNVLLRKPIVVAPLSVRNPIATAPLTAGSIISDAGASRNSPTITTTFRTDPVGGAPISTTTASTVTTAVTTVSTSTVLGSGTGSVKPIVMAKPKFVPTPSVIPPLKEADKTAAAATTSTTDSASTASEATKPFSGVPGRVITKQNMVITPKGIVPREEILATTVDNVAQTKKEKPKVPPKPFKSAMTSEDTSSMPPPPQFITDAEKSRSEERKPVDNANENDALDATVNTILDSARQLQQHQPSQAIARPPPPALVSVQCDDQPEIRKLHMFTTASFGGGGEAAGSASSSSGFQIPYTLTMRNIDSVSVASDANNGKASQTLTASPTSMMFRRSTNNSKLDLVHRKRLPSQDSYSSQDHSISPTTPDSGNIVEYIMRQRRRSLSTDLASSATTAGALNNSTTKRPVRDSRRRQTQPVSAECISAAVDKMESGSKSVDANKSDDQKQPPPQLAAAEDDIMDLPEPPPLLSENKMDQQPLSEPPNSATKAEGNEKHSDQLTEQAVNEMAKSMVSGILETDF